MVGEDRGELRLIFEEGVQGRGVDLPEGLVGGREDREGARALESIDEAMGGEKKQRKREGKM